MPKENASPDAILDALKKIDIVSELLEDKNKNNLKMIEGKVSGGKQIGPYARLLRPQEPERRAYHFQDRRRSTARRGNDRRVARYGEAVGGVGIEGDGIYTVDRDPSDCDPGFFPTALAYSFSFLRKRILQNS